MSQRIMAGFQDLTGSVIGCLQVASLAERYPSPEWHVSCTRCQSRWRESHVTLRSHGGVCRNDACRKRTEYADRERTIRGTGGPEQTRERHEFDPAELRVAPGWLPW